MYEPVLVELSGEVLGVLRIGVVLAMIHPLINDLLGRDARSQDRVPVEDVRSEPQHQAGVRVKGPHPNGNVGRLLKISPTDRYESTVTEVTDNRRRPIRIEQNFYVGLAIGGPHGPCFTVWPTPLSLAEECVSIGDNAP